MLDATTLGDDGFERPRVTVRHVLPDKLQFLREPHPYKVAYGGRASLKSTSFASALLMRGLERDQRVLCLREVQKSLADSVHLLLSDQIKKLGIADFYSVTDNSIRCLRNNTLFRFSGLNEQTQDSIKGYEGFDIFWFDEAQHITLRSFQIALPTLFRTKGAECWVTFNPELDTDEVWERFIVHPPPEARVQEMNWRDAAARGWMSEDLEKLRLADMTYRREDYDWIWEGKTRATVIGAVYGVEVGDMLRDGRFRLMPYDPRFPVHRIWDLGWNDLMVVIMVQKTHPSAITIVNYLEEKFATYPFMLETMDKLRYRWGDDWMPHDSEQHHPTSGTNAKRQMQDLGCRVRDIPKTGPEARIRAARMMFPRVYMDNTRRPTPVDRPFQALGADHLMGRLKRYRRSVPRTTNEEAGPVHDIESHGSDAFGGLAEIVEMIRNPSETPDIRVPVFENAVAGMGLLG